MANSQPSDSSHHGSNEYGSHKPVDGGRWYFSRKEIEENSPSRCDGINLKKENYLRKSYCTFLQDLGMRLKVPQLTIATSIIFCHRFFLRQSHANNDRRTIATVCMFLAGKVEETPRPLKDVILVSYEIIHKKDPEAVKNIKQKEVYEQLKDLILLGERIVLATLGFDLNMFHPYKPLVEAIKKFKVAQNALAQVAWNFVNDGLRTSLCLQFEPHHIAAGAIFLAAKFLKVKLPLDGERVWWQEFDVTPRQLEDVSNQMLELYEQNRPSANSEAEGSNLGGAAQRATLKSSSGNEEHLTTNNHLQLGATSKPGVSKLISKPGYEQPESDKHDSPARTTQNQGNDQVSAEMKSSSDHNVDDQVKEHLHQEVKKEDQRNATGGERQEAVELKDAIKNIDRDKVKAALERRKSRVDITRKNDLLDENDLIERELEDGIELAAASERNKRDRRQNWSQSMYGKQHDDDDVAGDGQHQKMKGRLSETPDFSDFNMEEGEVPDDWGWIYKSPNCGDYANDQNLMSPLSYLESEQKKQLAMGGGAKH